MLCIARNNKPFCTGCTACFHICPQESITMEPNKDGFLYPVINEKDCINCGLCLTVCPENNYETIKREPIPTTCFAAQHKNKEVLLQSSSGGAFTAIVQCFDDETYVYGVCFNENLKVIHRGVKGKDAYKIFQKSKYVQSDLQNSYREIKALLQNGEKVIFTGTPCQNAGLKSYLGDSYEGIIYIELLCHGVASPKVFNDYLEYLQKKYKSTIISFTFRDKHRKKGMWRDFLTKVQFKNGKIIIDSYDLYTRGFLAGLFTRESCVTCPYAHPERVGDIVIGDFWGLEQYDTNLCTDMGVSLVIPITNVGRSLMGRLAQYMQLEEVPIQYALNGNRVLHSPTRANPLRDKFFSIYEQYPIYEALSSCIRKPSLLRRVASQLPEVLKVKLRKLKF